MRGVMQANGNGVQEGGADLGVRVPSCRPKVYMRVKRLRDGVIARGEDDAPPLLRVRVDNDADANSSVRAMLSRTVVASCASDVLQQDYALRFRLLTKLRDATAPKNKLLSTHNKTIPSSTPLLSVEHVWDLHGCMVMDCMTLEQGQNGPAVTADTAAPEGGEGTSAAGAGADGGWSLYVLDDDKAPALIEDEDDEFDFGNLCITRFEDNDIENKNDGTGASEGVPSPSVFFGSHCAQRKRRRDDDVPEFLLSAVPQNGATVISTSDCSEDAEGAILLCQMLQDHGQDIFLLEEDEGCEPDLYLYPDHRKDDEYDSNAADFSGNEYPEESSSSRGSSSVSTMIENSEDYSVCHRDLWCEGKRGMTKSLLDSGWDSCED